MAVEGSSTRTFSRVLRGVKLSIAIVLGAVSVSAMDCGPQTSTPTEGDVVAEISLERNPLNGFVGVTDTIGVAAFKAYADGKGNSDVVLTGLNWDWQVSNTNIATIEKDGNDHTDHPTIRYKATGSTIVQVTLNDPRVTMSTGVSPTINIPLTVGEPVARIRLNPHSVTMKMGDSVTFTPQTLTASGAATLPLQNGTIAISCVPSSNCTASLVTSESLFIPVATSGFTSFRVRGLNPGVTDLIAVYSRLGYGAQTSGYQFADTVRITVTPPVVPARVTVDPTSANVFVGGTKQLSAKVYDASGNLISTNVSWTTKDANLATVNSNGVVSALSTGSGSTISNTVQIVATAATGVDATATLTIYKQVANVVVDPNPKELQVGSTHTFTATLKDNNGATIPSSATTITWSVDNTTLASVDQNGTVTANAAGSVKLTATTAEGVKGSADVNIVPVPPAPVVRVVVSPASVTLKMSDVKCQFSAKAYDAAGNVVAESGFRWIIDVSSVATLDQTGLATFKNPGTTAVRAFWGNAADAPGGAGQLTVNP